MTVRYDAVIIGAGADGLAAATILARRGLKTAVIERGDRPGGILSTLEFHPGYRASPFLDEIAPIPPHLHWMLDLTRRGATFVPASCSLALWPDRQHVLRASSSSPAVSLVLRASHMRAHAVAGAEGERGRYRATRYATDHPAQAWPSGSWPTRSMQDVLASDAGEDDAQAHLAALALSGRTADPFVRGSSLHLLAPAAGHSAVVMGGLGNLAEALARAAKEAGVEIRCGLDASDLKLDNRRIAGMALVDGSEFETRAVISTLDLKQTFLSLFPWHALPKTLVGRIGAFRMAGATARVLVALQSPPDTLVPELLRGPICIAPSLSRFADVNLAWRAGNLAPEPPVTLRFVSVLDPSLAPSGAAVMTATLGAVPFRLFDGAWTKEKRDVLRDRALAAAESVLPGLAGRVIATEVITPNDMDEMLGATEGDLWGGEIAADQMFDLRPWANPAPPRTPVRGLYLAGASSPLGPIAACASGAVAAGAVLSDLRMGG